MVSSATTDEEKTALDGVSKSKAQKEDRTADLSKDIRDYVTSKLIQTYFKYLQRQKEFLKPRKNNIIFIHTQKYEWLKEIQPY